MNSPLSTGPGWRAMRDTDLSMVGVISDAVHGAYTESIETFGERLRLFPAGCFVFESSGELLGYIIAHPWMDGDLPLFDGPLGALPEQPDMCYLHDLALLPQARGTGASQSAIALVDGIARKQSLPQIYLMAVNGADRFWRKQGFADAHLPEAKRGAYGDDTFYMRRATPEG